MLLELSRNCDHVGNALDALDSLLRQLLPANDGDVERVARMDSSRRTDLKNEVFRTLHSILAHTALSSKILWPREKRAERGAHLRALLGINSDSALSDRRLRNHRELVDERIESWALDDPGTNLVFDFLGVEDAIKDWSTSGHFRWYDPYSKLYVFRGERFDLDALLAAMREVCAALRAQNSGAE